MAEARQILFLQGLPGRFFADLGAALAAMGCGVHRVNFNGGDQWDWPRAGALNFRGPARAWPACLARLIRARNITDIVLFGDCRPLHRMARATAAGLAVQVHVFEEGYLRPDWVTLERGGVNGFSPLSADPAWWRRLAQSAPPVEDIPPVPSSLPRRIKETLIYYTGTVLLGLTFPYYRTHRPWPPLLEGCGWLLRLARRRLGGGTSRWDRLDLPAKSFFLAPLQLDSDYQLRVHSDFDGMQPALAEIVASFAARAAADAHLVVKAHPLDNGLVNWRKQATDYARALGVADRIHYLEDGDIDQVVRASRGVVTVNSTTGTLALAAGIPVITLGRAIYDLPGLTHQDTLEAFWVAPEQPRAEFYDVFRRVLANRCLLRGGFYADALKGDLITAAAARIVSDGETYTARSHRPRATPFAERLDLAAAQ
jgi:capsular polysaccharide export protein